MAERFAPRFAALDGMRLVGALAVLTTHAGFDSGDALRGPWAGLLARLDVGVALFFVVSGFLLFRPHVMAHLEGRRRPATRSYLLRRAVRILPVLWVAVVAAWLLVRRPGADPWDYVEVATLVHIYVETPLLAGLTQFWSLATEVAFYLLLPLLAGLLCRGDPGIRWVRRTIAVLLAPVVLGPVWMALATAVGRPEWRLWLPGFVGWFAVGMVLALWHAARTKGLLGAGPLDRLTSLPGTTWTIALGLMLVASTAVAGPLDLSEPQPAQAATKNVLYTVVGLFAVLPTIAVSRGHAPDVPARVPVLDHPAAAWLGTISYGVFGYHVILLALLGERLGTFNGHFWLRWGLTLLAVVPLAAASYYGLERPAMRRVRGARPSASARATTHATADHVST